MKPDPRRVLVVDDEVGVTRLLRASLERTGRFEVQVANSGGEALEAIRGFQPEVVLVDVIMPDMTGYDVAAALRRDPVLSGVPIIYLSAAVPADGGGLQGRTSGSSWIAKPATASEVMERIEGALAEGAPSAGPADRPEAPPEPRLA